MKAIITLTAGLVFSLLGTPTARASEVFPGALQEAAGIECVPVCLMCHTSNPGSATTWQARPLALALYANGASKGDVDSLKAAYKKFEADPANAAAVADVKAGREPGTHMNVCGPVYGCSTHVAQQAAAPRDFSGPLWVVGAVVAGGLLRRRKPRA